MEHLIKLKSGIETLETDEFAQLIQSFGNDYFASILFKHFHHNFINCQSQTEFDKTILNLRTFNDKISNIISLRNPELVENENENEKNQQIRQFSENR